MPSILLTLGLGKDSFFQSPLQAHEPLGVSITPSLHCILDLSNSAFEKLGCRSPMRATLHRIKVAKLSSCSIQQAGNKGGKRKQSSSAQHQKVQRSWWTCCSLMFVNTVRETLMHNSEYLTRTPSWLHILSNTIVVRWKCKSKPPQL